MSTSTKTEADIPEEVSDEELMRRIQQKDTGAFATLMDRYGHNIRLVAGKTLGSHNNVEDVLSESMFDLWRNARYYSPEKGRAAAWLMTLAKRKAIDHVRRKDAYSRAQERMEQSLNHEYTDPAPQNECTDPDQGKFVVELLALIPEAQALVLKLIFLKGMSQREVAESTGTPLGTVKTRMELGLKKLKRKLGQRTIRTIS